MAMGGPRAGGSRSSESESAGRSRGLGVTMSFALLASADSGPAKRNMSM